MLNSKMNILFTSSGRRLSLLQQFKKMFIQYGINGNIITADLRLTAPTAFISDKHYIVPRVTDPNYMTRLKEICRNEKIDIIIPLIDTELMVLSENQKGFEEIGVKLLVSSKELNEMAGDKIKTYQFFQERNISTPKVFTEDEINNKQYQFPLLIKPLDGSSSVGVTKINNEKELLFFKDYIPNAMIQEFVSGTEYTVDVMLDFNGNIRTVVPRLRIETRAGEVSKGVTKKDDDIIAAVQRVVNLLPGPVGCITLQCFKKNDGEITFIEINPRFGGGIPLSIEAGANFPLWVLQMCSGENFTEGDYSWRENLTMLRYDDAIFTESIQHDL
ncbi:ATP-grasp domain-containing protein [Paenibacillus sp. LjRoot153]|uniref:ATP-grasp domain-containing protein n=1 Tax=Paenibacillus sp. LjRoot153 TaxID=3342270 RepID=UPI003ECEC0CD